MATRPVSKNHYEPEGPTRWRCDKHGQFVADCAPDCPACTGQPGLMITPTESFPYVTPAA